MKGFRHQNARSEKMENISKNQFLNTKLFIMLLGFFLVAGLNAGEVHFRAEGQSSPYVLKGAANLDGGVLKLDGVDSYAQMTDSGKIGFGKDGMTVSAVVKMFDSGTKAGTPEAHDMFVWKDQEFLLGRVGPELYFNFYDGKDWKGMTLAGQLPVKEWVAVAAVARRVNDTAGSMVMRLTCTLTAICWQRSDSTVCFRRQAGSRLKSATAGVACGS